MTTHIDPTILHTIAVLHEIASHTECNYDYTAGLAQRIQQSGPIESMTVGQLLEALRAHSDYYNLLFKERA